VDTEVRQTYSDEESKRRNALLLSRIAAGLKAEDRSNAEHWRDKSDAECMHAVAELSRLGALLVRSRGFPIDYGRLEFPGVPRT
jgi:hypothetical protein